ncbi:MAG: type II toxin-antitoxin system HicA family toxin [Chloroflexi bacterium]|nr:type II toxin-antitoxin system HicA family toxin [Chloroflexota bacterium]
MPRKIRELKADLSRAGFSSRPGKGSHTFWSHPLLVGERITISGSEGDDAKPYQERELRTILDKLHDAQRRQP